MHWTEHHKQGAAKLYASATPPNKKTNPAWKPIEYLSLAEHDAATAQMQAGTNKLAPILQGAIQMLLVELAQEREKNKQLEAALDVQVELIACSGCEERDKKAKELVEALRKAVLWGECVSVRLNEIQRREINFKYFYAAREALAKYREEKK